MEIISHRGYWLKSNEKNTQLAFERSFELGFGTETDIRDLDGKLVISHDMPTGKVMTLDEFFSIYCSYKSELPLALNIKSDGLQEILKQALQKFEIKNYFLFDMSLPDLIRSSKSNLICYARESEYEIITTPLGEITSGVWFDYFNTATIFVPNVLKHLNEGRKVCLVSPELHGRDVDTYWAEVKKSGLHLFDNLMICTDKPEEAKNYFYIRE